MRKNIKIVISYDGTRYLGWQRLSGKQRRQSIQGYLEEVLEQVIGCRIRLAGSGRTDAGVHALGQVANFFVPSALFHFDTALQCREWRAECNRQLPEDIKIQTMEEVPKNFHSRYSAVRKTYEYRIDTGERPNVFQRKYTLWFPEKLNVDKMLQAAACLVGTHDFAAFSTGGKERIGYGADHICAGYIEAGTAVMDFGVRRWIFVQHGAYYCGNSAYGRNRGWFL